MKVVAFYLPQFHCIPENDKWWGKGFTEWVNVKKAKPLYEGHDQPRVPLNNNYYNLLDQDVMKWQSEIAKNHGVSGFCFYHYWFNGKMLLEKPVENFLKNKDIDIEFCLSWANEAWTNAWVSAENKLLMEQTYGKEKEWKEHFDYLLPFFKDDRYIKEDNKPLFVIYRVEIMDCYKEMMAYWNKLAIENGFDGIKFAYQHPAFDYDKNKAKNMFDYVIEYQPITTSYWNQGFISFTTKLKIQNLLVKYFKINIARKKELQINSYEDTWKQIVEHKPIGNEIPKRIPGAFVDWDNTPRRGDTGSIYKGACPEVFGKYFDLQVKNAKENYKSNYIFIFAWNEWAEGGYLEPDETNKFGYLEEIKKALVNNGEYHD